MTDELKQLWELLAKHVEELDANLAAIDTMLGSLHAAQFTDATLASTVDDVLKYTMMRKDIANFLANVIVDEIKDVFYGKLLNSTYQQFKDRT